MSIKMVRDPHEKGDPNAAEGKCWEDLKNREGKSANAVESRAESALFPFVEPAGGRKSPEARRPISPVQKVGISRDLVCGKIPGAVWSDTVRSRIRGQAGDCSPSGDQGGGLISTKGAFVVAEIESRGQKTGENG